MKLFIDANRQGYGTDQIRETMTVREMIEWLEQYDDDMPIYLRHDKGYTYGGITVRDFEEEEPEIDDDDEPEAEYQQRYDALVVRFNAVQARIDELTGQISETKARGQKVAGFIAELRKQDGLITEFDEGLWHGLVDYATVYNYKDVRFTFKDGTEINAFESH